MENNINFYRYKKFNEKYFLTTDHGSYCVLDEKEFSNLKKKDINSILKQKLEQSEILLDKSTIEESVRLTRKRNHFLFNGASLHIVVVTLRCNMNCIYCHASSEQENKDEFDMDKETAKKTVDFIFQTPSKDICIEFQGGEPLLNIEIIKYIVEYAKEKNKEAKKELEFTLVSNLSLMDDKILDYLIINNISICTSLDGPKELHDYNRIFSKTSNYEQVTYWIRKIQEEYKKRNIKNKKINALVTLTNKSLQYSKGIIDEYVKLRLNIIHLRYPNNLGFAKEAWKNIRFSADEFIGFWKTCMEYIKELQNKGINIQERMFNIMFKKINEQYDPNYLDLRTPCGAVISQLTYNYNGNIFGCDAARMLQDNIFQIGNVHKDNYKETTNCDKACTIINASINDQYICDDCVYKPYCGVCPVINYSEQGNIIGKITQTDRCKILKQQFDYVVKEKFINTENNYYD